MAGAGWHTSLREAAPDTLDLALSADPQPAVEWDSASRARIAMLLSVGSFDSALLLEGIVARLKDQGVRVIVVAPPLTEPSARQLVARVMRAGADDFVIATSAKDELLLRVEALAWRRRSLREQRHQSIYGIRVDRAARRLCHNAGHVTLTPCEFRVFSCLARCAGRPVARGSIQQSLARQSRSHTKNLVDVYILYLRRKLRRLDCACAIRTVRGVGYALVPTVASSENTRPWPETRGDNPASSLAS